MKKSLLISAALIWGAITATAQVHAVISTKYLGTTTIPVAEIDSISYENSTNETGYFLSNIIALDSTISIYNAALEATGLADSLRKHMDYKYTIGSDSTEWANDALVIPIASEYDNVAYPKKRLYKYTAFVVQDEVLKEKHGITDLDGLRRKAASIYDEVYPEDASVTDETDRRNSLNRFISYHLLNRIGNYYTLTCVDGPNSTLAINWDRDNWDIADWYETMMPHSLMKFSFPSGSAEGLYINRRGVQDRADYRGVFVPGTKVHTPEEMGGKNSAYNGIYHYIDDIVHYGRETQQVVLDERLRIDATTLSPDFMNSGARGHYTRSNYENGKYGTWDTTPNHNNRNTCLGFKGESIENFKFDWWTTHMHVRPRVLSFWSYQGDEVAIKGYGDITFKLPAVPSGTYELRIGTCVGFASRGVRQFLLDGEIINESVDFRPAGTNPEIGWVSDSEIGSNVYDKFKDIDVSDDFKYYLYNELTEDERMEELGWIAEQTGTTTSDWEELFSLDETDRLERLAALKEQVTLQAINAHDKRMREKGWMKGPASYYNATSEAGGTKGSSSFRGLNNTLRCIVGTFTTDGKTDHYLTIKTLEPLSGNNEFMLDYIELCPSSVYNNGFYSEEKW